MIYAYTRVSSTSQNLDRQTKELVKFYDIDEMYEEKISAKNLNRPELQKLLSKLQNGDTVIVLELSRLARSLQDLLNLISLFKEQNIKLISHKEKFDITTTTGKLLLSIISAINEFERENIHERQAQGIEIAKSNGLYFKLNKPKQIDEYALFMYSILINKKIVKRLQVAEKLGISTVTLRKRLDSL